MRDTMPISLLEAQIANGTIPFVSAVKFEDGFRIKIEPFNHPIECWLVNRQGREILYKQPARLFREMNKLKLKQFYVDLGINQL